jgi:hypothetical protein
VLNWYAAISKNPRTEASYDSHSKCTYSLDVSFKKLKKQIPHIVSNYESWTTRKEEMRNSYKVVFVIFI